MTELPLKTVDLETNSDDSVFIPEVAKHVTKKKRQDLQGIRGIAIISVLCFHFLPSEFPNGYLGVDQFFVLSGFLMCMLLRRSSTSLKSENFRSSVIPFAFDFYIRRLKRIVPLYLLIILISVLALFYIFPDTAYETNISSGKRALVFMSNRATTQEEDYFSMLAIAVDIFTHTWSLSVEVQFYLIIPILFIIGFKTLSDEFQVHFYVLLSAISLVYSYCFCTETQAFNSVFARVWQFNIGIILYLLTEPKKISTDEYSLLIESENSPTYKKTIKCIMLISIIWIVSYPVAYPSAILRPIVTISTGILMFLSENDGILSSHTLTYVGDLSYSLYLIHWPLYAYWKLVLSDGSICNTYLLLVLLISILAAVLSYECYEKWYLKLSNKSLMILCGILLVLNAGTLFKDKLNFDSLSQNSTRLDGIINGKVSFELAEKLNHDWSINDFKNLNVPSCDYETGNGPLGWCRHKELNGKYKLMLIGNSWAANHGRIIYEECQNSSKSILQGSSQGCDPLYNSPEATHCTGTVAKYRKGVVNEKPEFLFITTKFNSVGDPMPTGVTQIKDDPIYRAMRRHTDILAENVKYKLFLLKPLPHIDGEKVKDIVGMVKQREDLKEFDKVLIKRSSDLARRRYDQLFKDCKKCVSIDYMPLLWNSTTDYWRLYDENNSGLTYVTSPNHLSPHGLELVRNIYTEICRTL
ncbi:hypothetical protein GCK72_013801 [Caenorhabditis remanei]|uniref:Acyl_transf_3 domain-containing protein n=1 Tax=Caenorhabditis remanei TaxID=31234 RepID=A0A6A5GS08_CAERE|nr:hypothetical protein GCK72_013801 [Caenorhabditis remanei]KAF1757346.1 hypothetical protein GCK72_013801 [Caenorhabditis remanei]